MEKYFIEFLNSYGAGTFFAIILGGIGLCAGYMKFIGPLISKHNSKIRKDIEKEEAAKEFQEDLKNTLDALHAMQQQQEKCHASMQQYENRLSNVLEELEDTKKYTEEMRDSMLHMVESQNERINELNKAWQRINDQVDILIESDKEDIKAFITKEYNYWVFQKKEIDPYSLASIEARFESYKKEHGNTFVADLVGEIKKLPKTPATMGPH